MKNVSITPFAVILVLASLGACSILPESDPVQLLDPQVTAPEATGPTSAWTLNVARPEADPMRDSTRVLVRTGQGQLQVHASARWIAAAPELLRTLLVRYLRDAGSLEQVSAGASGLDRTLVLDLRRFELTETTGERLAAEIRIEVRLYDSRTADLLARHLFERIEPVESAQPADIVAGFETSLGELLPSIADWVNEHGAEAQED